jgi:hypothetical protein
MSVHDGSSDTTRSFDVDGCTFMAPGGQTPPEGRGVGHSVRSCEALKYSRFYGCQYVARLP